MRSAVALSFAVVGLAACGGGGEDGYPQESVDEFVRECNAQPNTSERQCSCVVERLQEAMQKGVGIIRDGKEIDEALAAIEVLKREAATVKAHGASQYNPGWHTALDIRNLLIVAEAVGARSLRLVAP